MFLNPYSAFDYNSNQLFLWFLMTAITRFEKARLITARALQLSFGAPPLVKADSGLTAYELASKELEEKLLPLEVLRRYPDGRLEKISV